MQDPTGTDKEALEYTRAKLALSELLQTIDGQVFIKYLFKYFEVGVLPEVDMINEALLRDRIGSLRPGKAFFEMVSEVNATIAGDLLAQIVREKHAENFEFNDDAPFDGQGDW